MRFGVELLAQETSKYLAHIQLSRKNEVAMVNGGLTAIQCPTEG